MRVEGQSIAPEGRRRRLRRLGLLAQVLAAALLVVLGARFVPVAELRRSVASVSGAGLAGYLALMLSIRAVSATRWWIIARHHLGLRAVTVFFLVRVEFLADLANLGLQSFIGGEAVRVWKVIQRTGDRKLAPASVALDRLVGAVALGVVCAPLLVALGFAAPGVRIPANAWSALVAIAAGFVLVGAIALRTLPVLRSLARRGFDFLGSRRFLVVPFLVSLVPYTMLVLAYRVGFPELARRSWLVVAIVAVLPRLGRAIPLSLFGVTAVEGSTLVVGKLLAVSTESLLLVAGLNLATKYFAAGIGAVAELVAGGARFFREVRSGLAAEAVRAAEGGAGRDRSPGLESRGDRSQ